MDNCPICGLANGFHTPQCGTLDIGMTDWEFVGVKTPEKGQWEQHWYQETSDNRTGTIHIVRRLVVN
jgi:hypothetical protein